MVHRLIYVSKVALPPDNFAILDIAQVAIRRNSASGITGYLYFDRDVFIQEIEGMKPDVDMLFASIARDPRHRDVRVILRQDAETRAFGEWTMAFHDGMKDGALLAAALGPGVPDSLTEARGPEVLRFLRELALGRADLLKVATTEPLMSAE
ncbi:MAG: BLUF domain-containing protein [Pseudomonadota bacterium]